MKVKDVERTANVAWSPKNQDQILLAAGTAAQQLDASFNTNAALEIYSLNLSEPGLDLEQKCSFPSEQRFHKLIWSTPTDHAGTIIGGCDGGVIKIYDATKLLKNENGFVSQKEKHIGPVHALDFNPYQHNLFATGAGESEIFIWDMNNLQTPMTPGSKSQPLEDVMSLSWNKQVQHILASSFPSRCVIWDLRKNEPIIKLTDTVSRVRWKVIAWHPEVATQLCLASEEDHSPVIQIWDLRFATSPLKTLENHQRGVLALAWCADDPDLLVSCGKDNRILCWNPSANDPNGEVLSEIARTNQWNFDIVWCPKNPALIACPSFDGHVSVYSIMGGKPQQFQTTNKIADSFPGMDNDYMQAPISQNLGPVSVDLTKPPKWLKRPVGASFSLGGKLVTFSNSNSSSSLTQSAFQKGSSNASVERKIDIFQIITEPELAQKSLKLEQTLQQGNFIEYCRTKADDTQDQHQKYIWHFIRANFESNPRAEILNLLGFNVEDVNRKFEEVVDTKNYEKSDDASTLNRIDGIDFVSNTYTAKNIEKPFKIETGNDTEGMITQALLLGNVKVAVELCLKAKKYADAIIIAMTGGSDLLMETQRRYLEESEGRIISLITALVTEDWKSLIHNCDITSWKEALAAVLTHAADEDLSSLCEQLGRRLEDKSNGDKTLLQNAQLCFICAGNSEKMVEFMGDKTSTSPSDLQELVEIISFLQKVTEKQGRQIQISEPVSNVLRSYAIILTSQGNMQTALSFLNATTDEKIAVLKERLIVHLSQKPVMGLPSKQYSGQISTRKPSLSAYTSNNSYGMLPNAANGSFSMPTISTSGSQTLPSVAYPYFNTSIPAGPALRPFSPASVIPPPSTTPKSANVSQSVSSASLPSRKYVLDPSVTTNQYGNFTRNQVIPNQSMNNPQYGFATHVYPTSMSNSSPVPVSLNSQNPVTGDIANLRSDTDGQIAMGREAIESMGHIPPVAPGWNDPPPVVNKPSRSQKMENPEPLEPITHPLFGVAPLQPQIPQMKDGSSGESKLQSNHFGSSNYQETNSVLYPPVAPEFSAIQGPPKDFDCNTFNQNTVLSNTSSLPPRTEKSSGSKVPIPEEHIHMKTVFDELRTQCSCAANNPQTKRKLDDVGRKLETLYDMLRENKLSPNTIASLHQMVQMVQNGNYQGGLNLHTQLVSGPDFAQIASFMPGLKVLLQCAHQMQVYLR